MTGKKDKQVFYVDKEGYQELLSAIEEQKAKIRDNNLGRKNAFDASAGDGWDSPDFEEIERMDHMLNGELRRKCELLDRAVIIEKHNDDTIIDIGDVIQSELIFSEDDREPFVFKLVATESDINAEIQEVAINTPMGSAVYRKKIGDTVPYTVGENTFSVFLQERLDLDKKKSPVAQKVHRQ